MKRSNVWVGMMLALTMPFLASNAAASECGLSCCIAAGVEGVGSATGFTVTMQYDSMEMKTIKRGTTKMSSTQVINGNLAARPVGSMYSVPTKMTMQKISTNVSYRWDDDHPYDHEYCPGAWRCVARLSA